MEIDLNCGVSEVEKTAFVDEVSYVELWHACAGPVTSLPKKGNVVVYFPQGHMEQAASVSHLPPLEMPTFNLPSQIFCRVLDVKLLANKENDEVYTRITLLPMRELARMQLECKANDEGGDRVARARSNSHMFCKTLTASDTSTHGGFSVPRRAAEDCFPPLNYIEEQRPSQELVAKDLHGVEWKFKHIYRGQPRRHLLTTGWSTFVSLKNLVSGDAILFLRGESGELRLGIRRAARPRNGLPDSIIKNQNCYPNVLSPVATALSSNIPFSVFYPARESHADFIVPYEKYAKSTASRIPVGTRFKMRFDFDESPERKLSGVVTGVGDTDPHRWPNSKWRCLMVRWDDDIMSNHRERVSPWDIDFTCNHTPLSIQSPPRMKKPRPNSQVTPGGSSITAGGHSVSDFEESIKASRVLQGQENVYRSDRPNYQLDFERRQPASAPPNAITNGDFVRNRARATFTGFLETDWFPNVLQGQEVCSLSSVAGKTEMNGRNVHQRRPLTGFYPFASEGTSNISSPQKGDYEARQATADASRLQHLTTTTKSIATEKTSAPATAMMHLESTGDDSKLNEKTPMCKLFGFPITEGVNLQGSSKRSCTKVHKQGSMVGRAIDLSKLRGYGDLLAELERLFRMDGLLRDPNNGWRILYTDNENDMMVVGDDPWNEFIEVVTKIHIYTEEEVEKMSIGMNSDDSKSCCLEEASGVLDVSKSSSVGQPDSTLML